MLAKRRTRRSTSDFQLHYVNSRTSKVAANFDAARTGSAQAELVDQGFAAGFSSGPTPKS
jgi:hypothetical protein